jgi:hypothetical protein
MFSWKNILTPIKLSVSSLRMTTCVIWPFPGRSLKTGARLFELRLCDSPRPLC